MEKNDWDAVAFLVTEYCQLDDVGNVLHTTVFASVTENEVGTRQLHVLPHVRDANQNDNEYCPPTTALAKLRLIDTLGALLVCIHPA